MRRARPGGEGAMDDRRAVIGNGLHSPRGDWPETGARWHADLQADDRIPHRKVEKEFPPAGGHPLHEAHLRVSAFESFSDTRPAPFPAILRIKVQPAEGRLRHVRLVQRRVPERPPRMNPLRVGFEHHMKSRRGTAQLPDNVRHDSLRLRRQAVIKPPRGCPPFSLNSPVTGIEPLQFIFRLLQKDLPYASLVSARKPSLFSRYPVNPPRSLVD